MNLNFYEQLASNLTNLFENGSEYNVVINVGQAPNNHSFKAHSIILNSRCSYLQKKLNSIANNINLIKTIELPDVSVEVFPIILKYIYSGTISLDDNPSKIYEALIAFNEFGLKEFVNCAQSFLIENHHHWLNGSLFLVLQNSFNHDFKKLQKFCIDKIVKNPSIIFDSENFSSIPENVLISILEFDLQIDEIKIWDYIIRWGIAQDPSLNPNPKNWSDENFLALKTILNNCLPLIRYLEISGEDIFEKIRPYRQILDSTIWESIEAKFMAPNKITSRDILPPRKTLSIQQLTTDKEIDICKIETNDTTLYHELNYQEMGKYDELFMNLNKLLMKDPNNATLLNNRGLVYRIIDDYEESLADLNKSLEIKPNSATALSNRGLVYADTGRYKEALEDLNKSLKIYPYFAIALTIRSSVYYSIGKYKESLEDINMSLDIEPNDAEALHLRGKIYLELGRYEESLEDLNKSLEINPYCKGALCVRILTYKNLGKYEKLLADFEKSSEISLKGDCIALKLHGYICTELKKYEESLTCLNKILKIQPNNVVILCMRGRVYLRKGKYVESLIDSNKALEILPNSADALVNRGITYLKMGKYNDSLADLNNLFSIYPNSENLLNTRGYIYFEMGRYNESINDFNKSLEISTKNVDALIGRGLCYLKTHNYKESLADVSKALEISPNNAETLSHRGIIYLKMKENENLFADLNKALEISPNSETALRIRGIAYYEIGQYNESLADLNKLLEISPDDLNNNFALLYRGLTYYKINNFKESLEDINKFLEFYPENEDALNLRKEIQQKTKYKFFW